MKLCQGVTIAVAVLLTGAAAASETNELQFKIQTAEHSDTLWRQFTADVAQHKKIKLRISTLEPDERIELSGADIVELQLHDAMDACARGALNLLPLPELLKRSSVVKGDYIANSVLPCAIGHSINAEVIVYDRRRFSSDHSLRLSEFFDVKTYPGKRALKKSARGLFEWILLNRGYSVSEVYPVLAEESIWKEIDSALSDMVDDIIWVDNDAEALALLENGSAEFAAVSTPNLTRRVHDNSGDKYLAENWFGVMWHQALVHVSLLGVPRSDNARDGLSLLRLAVEPTSNIRRTTAFGYAPVQRGQLSMIKDRYKRVLPIEEHLDHVFWANNKWWREEGQFLESRFAMFLSNHSQ